MGSRYALNILNSPTNIMMTQLCDSLWECACTWHHALQSTEVDVCAVVKQVKDLVGVLLDLILDVHLAALLVLLLTGQGVIHSEPACHTPIAKGKKWKRNFASFGQPTKLISCANHGNSVMCPSCFTVMHAHYARPLCISISHFRP